MKIDEKWGTIVTTEIGATTDETVIEIAADMTIAIEVGIDDAMITTIADEVI